jgi:hypothetical protein
VIAYILAALALAAAVLWWRTRSATGVHERAREQAAERALRTLRRDL